MCCLRTLGVLSVTLSLVWSMTLETTSTRYLVEAHSTYLGLADSPSINKSSFNLELSLAPSNRVVNVNGSMRVGIGTNLNTSLALNGTDVDFLISNSSREDQPKEDPTFVGEGRKNRFSDKNKLQIIEPNKKTSTKPGNRRKTTTKPSTSKKGLKKKHSSSNSTTPKYALSTLAPITIKLTKRTTKRPSASSPKSTSTPASKKRPKPTIKNILTKWQDGVTNGPDLKQDWYEAGVPYPSPRPEVTSSSPPFSISDAGSEVLSSSTVETIFIDELPEAENINPQIFSNTPSEPLQGVPPILPLSSDEDLESISVSSSEPPSAEGNPISTFNLDMLPSTDLTRDPSGSGCPTVHISSAVLSPLQRQGCSDLSLVLNTHYHQNQDIRNPAISTYDAAATAEDDVVEAVEDPIVDDGLANAGPTGGVASDSGVGTYTGGGGGPGGSGGSGGSGGDGGGIGGFKLPDLKPIFRAMGFLMRGLWWLMQKLMNPWLYIVPIVIFFKIGFLGILTLFPWWTPFVFLYFSVRTDEPKNTVSHVNHHHRPIVVKHRDGWYWDERSKTWKDVAHPHYHRRSDNSGNEEDMLDDKIIRMGDKFLLEKDIERPRTKFKDR